jgi:hypothetical protein
VVIFVIRAWVHHPQSPLPTLNPGTWHKTIFVEDVAVGIIPEIVFLLGKLRNPGAIVSMCVFGKALDEITRMWMCLVARIQAIIVLLSLLHSRIDGHSLKSNPIADRYSLREPSQ